MSQETTNPWDSGTAASSQAAPTSSGGADAWGTPDGSATPDAASSSDWLNSAPRPRRNISISWIRSTKPGSRLITG